MVARSLRIELRRSGALWIAVLGSMLALGMLYGMPGPWNKGTAPWNGEWTGLAEWTRRLLLFLWPLALGAGAWQGMRDNRSGVTELVSTLPAPALRRRLPHAGALAVGALCAYALVVAVGAGQVAGSTDYLHTKWLPVAVVGALSLVAAVWLGMGIGRLVPHVVTPPIAAVMSLVCLIALMSHPGNGTRLTLTPRALTTLSPALDTGTVDVFSTVPTGVSVLQVVWFAAVAAAGLVLLVASRLWVKAAACLPVLAAAAVVIVAAPNGWTHKPDDDARALTCVPEVCVTRVHSSALTAFAPSARSALTELRVLPDAPTGVRESAQDRARPDPTRVQVNFESAFGTGGVSAATPDQIRSAVLDGAGTQPCPTAGKPWSKVRRDIVARSVAGSWFDRKLTPSLGNGYLWPQISGQAEAAWRALRRLPPNVQRTRIAEFRAASLSCNGDLLGILSRGADHG